MTVEMSRRGLLGVFGGVVAMSWFDSPAFAAGTTDPAGAMKAGLKATWLTSSTAHFDSSNSVAVLLHYPQVLSLFSVPKGLESLVVVLDFDSRVFQATEEAFSIIGNAVDRTSPAVLEEADRSRMSFEVVIPSKGVSNTDGLAVSCPLRPRSLYPLDSVDAGTTRATILTPTGTVLKNSVWAPQASAVGVAPWGFEVEASWVNNKFAQAGANVSYRTPGVINVISTGPYAAPAGSTLDVIVDKGMIASIGVARVSQEMVEFSPDLYKVQSLLDIRGRVVTITFDSEISPGTALLVELVTEVGPASVADQAAQGAIIDLNGPFGSQASMRRTGKYSLVDRTTSGRPRSNGVAKTGG